MDTSGHTHADPLDGWEVRPKVPEWMLYSPLEPEGHGIPRLLEGPTQLKIEARAPSVLPEVELVRLTVDMIGARWRMTRLEVDAAATSDGLAAETIRRIPTAAILRQGVKRSIIFRGWDPDNEERERIDENPFGPRSDPTFTAALVYYLARAVGQPPTAAVAEHFGISSAAAAQRVARARKAGHIPPTTRGKVS